MLVRRKTEVNQARWHTGMSSTPHAADPGSNPGKGDGTTKINRSLGSMATLQPQLEKVILKLSIVRGISFKKKYHSYSVNLTCTKLI